MTSLKTPLALMFVLLAFDKGGQCPGRRVAVEDFDYSQSILVSVAMVSLISLHFIKKGGWLGFKT